MASASEPRPTDLYQQRRLLESLGFGFVEEPFTPPPAEEGPRRDRPAAPAPSPPPRNAPPPPRATTAPAPASRAAAPAATTAPADGAATLATLATAIKACRRCPLELTRNHALPGAGNPRAPLMVVLEAPSLDEDRSGDMVTGELGELLDKILKAINQSRETVFLAHAVRCCPPQARPPRPEELAACTPYMVREVELVRPRALLSFGIEGLQALLPGVAGGIAALRGRWHDYRGTPMMATFSLSYMHRFPDQKRKVWADLQEVMKRLAV